ncbi:MAG TPA: hypothetical protein VFB71_05220 [Ramlibacter sp.]|nr:hypothetical protein [Ramlibacter sp.]
MTNDVPQAAPQAQAAPPKLFRKLRTDPKKREGGVWVTHPDTQDQFRVLQWFNPKQIRAAQQARKDWELQHGEGSGKTEECGLHVLATSMATGLIMDWKLADNPDRPYDPAAMAAALSDPELEELAEWLKHVASIRVTFKIDAGN